MLSQASRRTLVAAVLAAVLLLPAVPVQALPLDFGTPGLPAVAGLLERLWALVGGLADGLDKEGASIDPDGHHLTPPSGTGSSDPGVAVTPDGGATTGTSTNG